MHLHACTFHSRATDRGGAGANNHDPLGCTIGVGPPGLRVHHFAFVPTRRRRPICVYGRLFERVSIPGERDALGRRYNVQSLQLGTPIATASTNGTYRGALDAHKQASQQANKRSPPEPRSGFRQAQRGTIQQPTPVLQQWIRGWHTQGREGGGRGGGGVSVQIMSFTCWSMFGNAGVYGLV
jgi:hypothetical protein